MLRNVVFEGGYFKPFQYEFLASISDEDKHQFQSLDNVGKIKFVFNSQIVSDFVIPTSFKKKDESIAEKLKEAGNTDFIKGNYEGALQLYKRSIMTIPLTEGNQQLLAVTAANQSAALYRLGRYTETVDVIENVLKLPYPKELEYKVKERMARSYEATGQFRSAEEVFRETIKSINYASLIPAKKKEMKNEIQKTLRRLASQKDSRSSSFDEPSPESVVGGRSDQYPSLSSFVTIKNSAEMGRYAEAVQKIKTGDVVLTEDAHCAVLLAERCETNCFHCFRRFSYPVPCPNCSAIAFCSNFCRDRALESHHKMECGILQILWDSGASVTCLMALRIISQKGLQYFLGLKDSLTKGQEGEQYCSSDYKAVYNLVTHSQQRGVVDLLLRTSMAVLLLRCLKMTDYFECSGTSISEDKIEGELTENEAFIGGLLLHHLELLQFNAHEISEIILNKDGTAKSVFLGGGLYPTLALFNHSCNPSIVRYFHGTSVAVRTVRTLHVGEMVSENYGPNFVQVHKEERQNILKDQYWFECKCIPCIEDWPTFVEMDSTVLRFRCDAGTNCNNVVCVPTSIEHCFVQCTECKGYTNILKGLKALQATDDMNCRAQQLAKNGKIPHALSEYIKVLDLLAETLAPPFKDYCICQESIRYCIMHFGNKYHF
ncbi:SET and MYND domain-containing protein 4-like [Schistocerca americana]|uniref:SET and MYND domain-containing protein 4-like n=1 Tax=Schistocerca americana TaxID=7009 RepID=UPI001F4F1AA3|nr:SET and MYND domain-containing protein 4-like [Schistocerca americana]